MTEFCGDDELGYVRSRTIFAPGAGLTLDESYRRAHLPLVAPGHPRAIARDDAKGYAMGRHERIWSLVLPVPGAALCASPAFVELGRELRAARFAPKIAWDILPRRRDKLHATICGQLATGEEPPRLDAASLGALGGLGSVHVELRGLFTGNVNVGRLYLRAYPERRDGANLFQHIQRLLGRRETDLYVVGLWNLLDDLDAGEAGDLARLVERWWERPLLRFEADTLWLMGASDDLVLDSTVAARIALGKAETGKAETGKAETGKR